MSVAKAIQAKPGRPNVFEYLDHRAFLTDLFSYFKAEKRGFSLRNLSKKSGFRSSGYLSMILNGSRSLTASALHSLNEHLDLSHEEASYLELLRSTVETKSQTEKIAAHRRLQTFGEFHSLDPKITEEYRYLSQWYYVAIRELTTYKDFKPDPAWIQSKLRPKISLDEARIALKFLFDKKLLVIDQTGQVTTTSKNLECEDGLYRVAMGEYYGQLFKLAADAISTAPRNQRPMRSFTAFMSGSQFREIKTIIDKMGAEITKVLSTVTQDSEGNVYSICMSLFPVSCIHEPKEDSK